MSFEHDTTGVQESGEFKPIPAGKYMMRLGDRKERTNKDGYPLVEIDMIVDEGEYKGRIIKHYITFLPPENNGAGIAMHFLHAIGEQYEGKFTVDPMQWNAVIPCDVIIDPYTKKDGTEGKSNKIKNVYLSDINISGSTNTGVPF